jgi:DNA-binding transcriptional LysR family regulator
MLSLHQLRCFLAVYERGSITAAAHALGYSQPTLSEQVRLLERALDARLFRRAGRGVVPTEAAETLRVHAERVLEEAEAARRAVAAVRTLETGTVRFGLFGSARLYGGADLVADVLARYPGVRVELVGQNSADVHEDLRRGRLEAAMIALPLVVDGMTVTPVAREELVYVSARPERIARAVPAARLAEADLVLPETTWRSEDPARVSLAALVQEAGLELRTRVEVEDVETAVQVTALGLADTVAPRGAVERLLPGLPAPVGWVSLDPPLYSTIAVVHRKDAVLSPAARLMIELATARIRTVAEPVGDG